jgi:hypothetical protein
MTKLACVSHARPQHSCGPVTYSLPSHRLFRFCTVHTKCFSSIIFPDFLGAAILPARHELFRMHKYKRKADVAIDLLYSLRWLRVRHIVALVLGFGQHLLLELVSPLQLRRLSSFAFAHIEQYRRLVHSLHFLVGFDQQKISEEAKCAATSHNSDCNEKTRENRIDCHNHFTAYAVTRIWH